MGTITTATVRFLTKYHELDIDEGGNVTLSSAFPRNATSINDLMKQKLFSCIASSSHFAPKKAAT